LWNGFTWLRIGPVAGSCEHGNETLGSKKGEFRDYLSDYQLVKEDSAPLSYLPKQFSTAQPKDHLGGTLFQQGI